MQAAALLIERTEARRLAVGAALDRATRSKWGQVFTPGQTAEFIASLVDLPEEGTVRILDPGAGVGSLAASIVAAAIEHRSRASLEIVAYEIDPSIVPHLEETLRDCTATARQSGISVEVVVRPVDFIPEAAAALCGRLSSAGWEPFDLVIMNPPYRKIDANGPVRQALARVGIAPANLYAAFVYLGAALLRDGGQLAAITPRSFANGPYFESFRKQLLTFMRFDRIHTYEQRGRVFGDSDVLQENIVFSMTRGRHRPTIVLSASRGDTDAPVRRSVSYADVVHDHDPHTFIRLPVDEDATAVAEQIAGLPATLRDIGVQVSTGRVVDFRAREHLVAHPSGTDSDVPLIYPSHFQVPGLRWPLAGGKKANAFARGEDVAQLLLPNETFVLVKRFTSKEERRRVVATISSPELLPGDFVAFENHLNVFHCDNAGLRPHLAVALACFLNSTVVDRYVRQFSGHTQINATDLRNLRYPGADELIRLGAAVIAQGWPTSQQALDATVAAHVAAIHGIDDLRLAS